MSKYHFEVYGDADLRGPWCGWRIRGAWLISPQGDRLNPQRLAGLLFLEDLAKRRPKRLGVVASDRRNPIEAFRAGAALALARADR